MTLRSTARAMPTMLRVGAAEALAYRAEFVIWMLTSTLPLVMLGLWTSVASEGPFASYESRDFIAYYLATLIVRNLTGTWVVWQINEEVRHGTLSMRLLRPVHPFAAYAATHLSAIPLRGVVAIPFTIVLLVISGKAVTTSAAVLAVFVASLAGAWALVFFTLVAIGSLSLFIERSLAVFEVYLGVFAVLSGYLIPLDLLPSWAEAAAAWTPFRYMLSFPVELLLGRHPPGEAVELLAIQLGFVVVAVAGALALWRAGIRKYEAYGA